MRLIATILEISAPELGGGGAKYVKSNFGEIAAN